MITGYNLQEEKKHKYSYVIKNQISFCLKLVLVCGGIKIWWLMHKMFLVAYSKKHLSHNSLAPPFQYMFSTFPQWIS